jgi:hypothetical protein
VYTYQEYRNIHGIYVVYTYYIPTIYLVGVPDAAEKPKQSSTPWKDKWINTKDTNRYNRITSRDNIKDI